MTDRYVGFMVVLEKDLREDDAQATLTAIQQIRGVLSVEPVVSEPLNQIGATMREQRRILALISELNSKIQGNSVVKIEPEEAANKMKQIANITRALTVAKKALRHYAAALKLLQSRGYQC